MLSFIQGFSDTFSDFPVLFSFAAAVVGDPGIILASFLAAIGDYAVVKVFFWTLLATILLDVFWFYIPRSRAYRFLVNSRILQYRHDKLEKFLQNVNASGNKDIYLMVLAKALAGTRVIMILALSLHGMRFVRFFITDIIINAVWVSLLVFVGYLARNSFEQTLQYFENTQLALLVLFGFFLLVFFLSKKAGKHFFKKQAPLVRDAQKKMSEEETESTSRDENHR